MTNASGTTMTFLNPLCSSDCLSFCCVSRVTTVSGACCDDAADDAADELSLRLLLPLVPDVWAKVGVASRRADAIMGRAWKRIVLISVLTVLDTTPLSPHRPIDLTGVNCCCAARASKRLGRSFYRLSERAHAVAVSRSSAHN